MKKKFWLMMLVVLICITMTVVFVACDFGGSDAEKLPTAAEVVAARMLANESEKTAYDFAIDIEGNIDMLDGNANISYDGQYRYDTERNLSFKRNINFDVKDVNIYSGAPTYIMNTGDIRLRVSEDKDGSIKKVHLDRMDDDGLDLMNMPFAALVDGLEENNIEEIALNENSEYKYKAKLSFNSDSEYLDKIIDALGALGSVISVGDFAITNPAGMDFYFDIENDKLTAFTFAAEVTLSVKGVSATMILKYEQHDNSTAINTPNIGEIITDKSDIGKLIGQVNDRISEVKNRDVYSLDMMVENEFDAGWQSSAKTDSYTGRMYKNKTGFNHSYEYKFDDLLNKSWKYTVGNIIDGSVYKVSRNGINSVTATPHLNASSQFDYLTELLDFTADDVDCVMQNETEDGGKLLSFYLNNGSAQSISNKALKYINSNDAEDKLMVDNCMGDKVNVEEAVITVELNAQNALVSIVEESELTYVAASGDNKGEDITLNNVIKLDIDKTIEKAKEYEVPKKAEGTLGLSNGLDSSKNYIL